MLKQIFILAVIAMLTACAGTPTKIAPEQMQSVEQTVEATSEGTNTAAADGKKYTKVCKTYATTGTRFKEKICRTQEAWDEIERKAKESLEQNTPMQSNNPVGG